MCISMCMCIVYICVYVHTYIYIYVILLICSVAFFLSLLPWRSVGRSNFDWGLQKINNVDSNNDIQI